MSESLDNTQVSAEATQTPQGQSGVAERAVPAATNEAVQADNNANELIAGKFKNVDDLVKSYKELEREHTKARQNKDIARTSYDETDLKSAKDNLGSLGDEIVSNYIRQKEEGIFKKSVEAGHHYLTQHKKVLMELAKLPEYRLASYPEIYEATFGKPEEEKADVSERKLQASAPVSGSQSPNLGSEDWNQEKIDSLSDAEYAKMKPQIMAYYQSKRGK